MVAMNRNGEIAILDDSGRERERYGINYGAVVSVTDGQAIDPGAPICSGTLLLFQFSLKFAARRSTKTSSMVLPWKRNSKNLPV